jgi:muramoyltetrapeptide carboxypeptidase LdcA involved in peptidoglycan recycling
MSGKILLLETCEGEQPDKPLPLEQIRSLLADLVNLDVFDQIAGLILGRPTGHVGKDLEEFEGFVGGLCVGDFPILMGVDVGHTDPLLTVPFNALSRLDSEEDIWEVLEPGVMG